MLTVSNFIPKEKTVDILSVALANFLVNAVTTVTTVAAVVAVAVAADVALEC
jgi:hypothetical protein